MKTSRQSNIELLRCLLMFMIVILHFVAHNYMNVENPAVIGDSNFFSASLLLSLTECAVDCFVLISGYFTIKLTLRKIALFLLPILFYEFIISILYLQYGGGGISITPFNYWFVRPYFVLMLLSPILNLGLKNISEYYLRNLLLIGLVFFIIPIESLTGNMGKNAIVFIYLYLIGYYIRNYMNLKSIWLYIGGYVASVTAIFSEFVILNYMGKSHIAYTIAFSYDSIFIFLAAISLFLIFLSLDFYSKFINWIAASAFYVYIITENVNVYRGPYSMYNLINVQQWNESSEYALWMIVLSFVTFAIAICIDKIRIILFGRIESCIGSYLDRYESKFNR